jgi:hypothetical protein
MDNVCEEMRRDLTDARGPTEQSDERHEHMSGLMIGMRYVLPALVVLAGVIVMSLGSESELEGGAGIVGAGLSIYAMNWLYRASVDGDRARDEEQAARDYFDVHGRWPDEAQRAERRPTTTTTTVERQRSAVAGRTRGASGRRLQ